MAVKPTRLLRAIRILKKAAGSRPFALVIESAHEDAPVSRLKLICRENLAAWQVRGLLHSGLAADLGDGAADSEDGDCAES
jgi:hypothetical protein